MPTPNGMIAGATIKWSCREAWGQYRVEGEIKLGHRTLKTDSPLPSRTIAYKDTRYALWRLAINKVTTQLRIMASKERRRS